MVDNGKVPLNQCIGRWWWRCTNTISARTVDAYSRYKVSSGNDPVIIHLHGRELSVAGVVVM